MEADAKLALQYGDCRRRHRALVDFIEGKVVYPPIEPQEDP